MRPAAAVAPVDDETRGTGGDDKEAAMDLLVGLAMVDAVTGGKQMERLARGWMGRESATLRRLRAGGAGQWWPWRRGSTPPWRTQAPTGGPWRAPSPEGEGTASSQRERRPARQA